MDTNFLDADFADCAESLATDEHPTSLSLPPSLSLPSSSLRDYDGQDGGQDAGQAGGLNTPRFAEMV